MATKLGDPVDDMVIIGGLVPSLHGSAARHDRPGYARPARRVRRWHFGMKAHTEVTSRRAWRAAWRRWRRTSRTWHSTAADPPSRMAGWTPSEPSATRRNVATRLALTRARHPLIIRNLQGVGDGPLGGAG